MDDLPARILGLRNRLKLTQVDFAPLLGISENYVSLLEGGKRQASPRLISAFLRLEESYSKGEPLTVGGTLIDWKVENSSSVREDELPYGKKKREPKMIPVVGWAHAGKAESYEELPESWTDRVPTECQDEKAFALRLEGDSMEPQFKDGDLLVVMPGTESYSGCFVVARFKDDGVMFRRLETVGDVIQLVPLNDRYDVTKHAAEDFAWIYPVWGRWSQLWRR